MPPSSVSSPAISNPSSRARLTAPVAASNASAIGRSKLTPSFRRPAGDRFTVIRSCGKLNPEFSSALRTRSRLSRTTASGSPTVA